MTIDVRPGTARDAVPSPTPPPPSISLPAAAPVAFDGLFGWLHPAAGRRGVVLCGAHGFEQVAAHRPWRALAERLAAAGCPTLRFDYPGEGDSADVYEARVADRVAAVRRAVRFLREAGGVAEVVLVGLRLGAAFAALAADAMAAEGEAPDRLVLLAPPPTGRAYLREMRLRARSVGRLPDGSPAPQAPDALTLGGFRMGPAFLADLADLDLARLDLARGGTAGAPRVLLLGPETATLSTALSARGCAVETGPLPGLAVLVGDPVFAETPEADFARVAAFAADAMAAPGPALAPAPPPAGLSGAGWSEAPARFGPGLFGIGCAPARPEPGAPTVVFVTTGMTVRSGWGRQTTGLARSLAAEGVASLRFDLAGVGDSDARADGSRPLFAPDGFADVALALDHLAASGGPVVLVGNCSGAYAAFHALCRDARVEGALLVNLFCFDWDPNHDIDAVLRRTFGSATSYAARLKQAATWRRLLRGEIRVRAIAAVLAGRALDAGWRRVRRLFRPGPPGGSVRRRVAALRRRGARIRMIYTAGDPGLVALRRQLGPSLARAERRLGAPVAIVPGADHNFGSAEAQALLAEHLRDLLRAVRRPAAEPSGAPADPQRRAAVACPACAG